jgi:protein BCP1
MPPQRKRKAEEPAEDPGSEEDSELSEDDGSDSSFPTEGSDDPAADGADDDEGYEDDEEDVKEITVEFQFFEPQEIDFLGLKTLLAGYLNGEQYDSSGLIDAIITDVSQQKRFAALLLGCGQTLLCMILLRGMLLLLSRRLRMMTPLQ